MLPHMLEIAGDKRHLCKERGFLAVYEGGERLGRQPLADLSMVLVCGHGVTWSNDLLVALAEACVPVVLCGRNMMPAALLWALHGNHLCGERIRMQSASSLPLRKRMWQAVVKSKIDMQAQLVEHLGGTAGHLRKLGESVRSGDTENAEATAARLYWSLCFGPSFRRDRDAPGTNAMLNYGYTVLRAAVARAVMLSGLHPAFGLFHCNARNSLPLVDDLMEPFRPVVDMLVLQLVAQGEEEVTTSVKQRLAMLPTIDMRMRGQTRPVGQCTRAVAESLVAVLAGERKGLSLPDRLLPLEPAPS